MKNNRLSILLLLFFSFTSDIVFAQEAYINEKIFHRYVASGYANKYFVPSGKTDKAGLKQGKWKDYGFAENTALVKDGAGWKEVEDIYLIKSEGSFKDGNKTGKWKIYLIEEPSKKEILIQELNFVQDTTNGPFKTYYPSGKVKAIGKYENNRLAGTCTSYFEDGSRSVEMNYVAGLRQGETRAFHRNGAIAGVSNYKDDQLDGTMTNYYPNGKIQQVANFKNGKNHGIYRYFYENGQLWAERYYEEDKLLRVTALFDRNGNALEKGTFENGNGFLYYYDENGKPYAKTTYTNGEETTKENYTKEPEWFRR